MKMKKIVFAILLTFLLLGLAGILYLKSYFTQERIKALFLPALENKLHGKISIDNFGFSFIRGIELSGINVQMEGKKGVSSFQCEQALLRPRLFPLIFGQLVVSEIRLMRPQFFILGGAESIAAFPAGLLKRESGGEREEKKSKERETTSIVVEGLKIEKGDILLINPEGSGFLPPLLQLEAIDFAASNLSLSSSIPFSFSGKFKGIESDPLRIRGLISPREKSGEMNIAWEKLQVKSLNKALRATHPFLTQGEVDLELRLNIKEASPLVSEGRIKVAGARLARSEPAGKKGRGNNDDVDAEAIYHLTVNPGKGVEGKIEKARLVYRNLEMKEVESTFSWQEKTLNLTQVKANVGKGLIQGQGTITFDKEARHFSIDLKGDRIPIDRLLLLTKSDPKRNITGILAGDCRFAGMWEKKELSKEDLQGDGEIRLQEGKISGVKSLEKASALLGYEGLSPLTVSEGKMGFRLEEGKVKTEGWLKSPDLEVSYKGNVKLDSSLNLHMEIMCSPRIFANFKGSGMTDLLKDEQGRVIIPLKLKGTWNEPSVSLDTSEFKKMIKDKFQQFYEGFREGK